MKALFITYANTRATIIAEVRPMRPLSVIPEDTDAALIKKDESKRPGIRRPKDRIRSKNVVKMN